MTLAKRLVPTPAGKKNDGHPTEGGTRHETGSAIMTIRGPRKRRILLSIIALIALYLFIKYLPTDLPPVSHRSYDSRYGLLQPHSTTASPDEGPQDAPPRPQGAMKERYFDGPVKFYHLTSSLYRAILPQDNARNVLYGISSIKSASNVLPMACKMAIRQRNRVHLAVFGRQDIAIEAIQDIYGLRNPECPVLWHDARPDFAAYSSDQRMEVSVRASLNHLLFYLKPHVVIINDPGLEDHYFVRGISDASDLARVPVITLPNPAIERLEYLSELDGPSLGNWNELQMEILVHGSATSSASFIRLLKSIEHADYTGGAYPRITIELPETTDLPAIDFLSTFRWPPGSSEAESKMTVRRRLSSRHLTPVEASMRTVESFYPIHPSKSHLLVLTADAELAPSYFGYLKYLLLEYKYSSVATSSEPAAKLMGISLVTPSSLLNGSSLDVTAIVQDDAAPLFLWQAPNSQAALFFGDKWVEYHSFLSRRFTTALDTSSIPLSADLVSPNHPAWLKYLLELARARAYYMLYPAVRPGGSPLVTIHDELHAHPIDMTETRLPATATIDKPASINLSGDEVLTADHEQEMLTQPEAFVRNTESQVSLLSTATGNSTLPQLQSLSHLSYEAIQVTAEELQQLSTSFAEHLSLHSGGCKALQDRPAATAGTANDLFCDGNSLG